jgi:serine/threonine-protein phosphatase 2A activator
MSTPFEIPSKRILSSAQLIAFQSSATHNTLVSFVEALNASVVGVKLRDPCSESPVGLLPLSSSIHLIHITSQAINAILRLLDAIEQIARETPPVENKASRFGNPAFRSFYDKVQTVGLDDHSAFIFHAHFAV